MNTNKLIDLQKTSTETELLSKQKLGDNVIKDGLNQSNFIQDLKQKASETTSARIDNEQLFHQKPTLQDLCVDSHTSAVAVIHVFLLALSVILFGLMLWRVKACDILLACIAVVSNLYGIVHSMYSGSITHKAEKVDAALQKLAAIFSKFAKALNIQETHLARPGIYWTIWTCCSRLNLASLNKNASPLVNDDLLQLVDKFEDQLKIEVIKQHVLWLRALFDQFRLLDHRSAILESEFRTLKSKLPNKSLRLFDNLAGVDKRMQRLSSGTNVLPYTDLAALVNKVIDDLQSEMLRLSNLLEKKRRGNKIDKRNKDVSKKISQHIQVAGDALMGTAVRQQAQVPQTANDDADLEEFLTNQVDLLIEEEEKEQHKL
ncbi:hypothetical protein RFI_25128 [Reticulomyxa filosa]|uniref:Uncharacterized protein n=1 Tax=Reticulomyxa filosa TaxID=46433 RepID=X6ME06_RETFI|nr:hypothetical protein RFI_25128 [Reticulomyxa filosa]|eukprot:ETO12248.1 hypothetical protein RFI_25128 [Reticulomyxa filosa]